MERRSDTWSVAVGEITERVCPKDKVFQATVEIGQVVALAVVPRKYNQTVNILGFVGHAVASSQLCL